MDGHGPTSGGEAIRSALRGFCGFHATLVPFCFSVMLGVVRIHASCLEEVKEKVWT